MKINALEDVYFGPNPAAQHECAGQCVTNVA